ncbi:hypothetical protein F5B19DRAFT_360603 [Rostrohypoxylon terebratum]|nr:hypothetical protein F5B19DRAFT_360603 [Rostrohypoxylon terebratum]
MADVYRRSGRGGAGNFYSQEDIEEATKGKREDIEVQKPQPLADDKSSNDPADVSARIAAPMANTNADNGSGNGAKLYSRSGRGGAGNFVDVPSSTSIDLTPGSTASKPAAPPSSPPSTSDTQSYTLPTQPPARGALSGRGGAGNWVSTNPETAYDPEQERKRREALDAHILQDIRESLPQPPKIHYMHRPGRERRPDLASS